MSIILCFGFCTFASGAKTVLFDEGHGQLFHAGSKGELDLSGLASVFGSGGWTTMTSTGEITDSLLAGVDALVISGPFKPVTRPETDAILRFLDRGGSLCVMLHIGYPVADLLHALNVSISNGIVHEQHNLIQDNDIEFGVVDLQQHELTGGLEQICFYGAWALLPTKDNARAIAQTGDKAWIDLNGDNKADAQQAFATCVAGTRGAGRYVVFSDDTMFQNRFLKGDNYKLGENLANWMGHH